MGNVEEYVDHLMSVQNFCSTHATGMMELPKENSWKWDVGNIILSLMTHSPKPISTKASNEIGLNTSLQCTANKSYSVANNL